MTTYVLSFCLLAIISCYGQDNSALPQEAYSIKAQQVLESCGKLTTNYKTQLMKYTALQKRDDADRSALLQELQKNLMPISSRLSAQKIFSSAFAEASNELRGHRVRRLLQCRIIDDLTPFEEPYASEIPKVTREEFKKKLEEQLSADQWNNILLAEASLLAQEMLRPKENSTADDKKQ